ncbi:DUF3857 domain-containing protein [Ichthyenterobacterium sp. W332]|uniref:DUF3857 domain-containing protein n=1 Tax=Microcosmobacter mediterraneus TaxID=3075607 RepID=A0ABU2YLW6_9FLAO|nr:DUF3857 domain-containing protein [Ichthyenterobacterium sp. W332]MDT0559032.1 DUF3857 domain-containing protein [Ichthyenterobacterium sp. W332]
MLKYLFTFVFISALFTVSNAQESDKLIAITIPDELSENANAVVRYELDVVEIEDYNRFTFTSKRIVTIYNEYGKYKHGAVAGYDDTRVIKSLEAKIYDALGKEIKRIKKKDFVDESAVPGGTLYSDSRVKYLDYTPVKYPYTVVFECKMEYKTTAFVPRWLPVLDYYMSTEFSEYKIINNTDIKLKFKASNFKDYNITELGELHYKAEHLKAIKKEQYAPSLLSYVPELKVALTEFDMEGVKGKNTDWSDYGQWMYNNLLLGTTELSEEAKKEIRSLTKDAQTNEAKAKIVYEYVQNKTRYISVQVGIGGWKPMLASDVDRLGYGDCKGLTNYTKALLEEVGVEAYYTVVYGKEDITNIDKEFSATEGNHVILCLPTDDENIFLECTSQTNPFGYVSNFTDDRDVLLVTPEGGKIAHTTVYKTEENIQTTTANASFDVNGILKAEVSIKTYGYQYGLHDFVELLTPKKQKLHYKDYWDNINNLTINDITLQNDKDLIEFKEDVVIETSSYGKKSGTRYLIEPNAFNKITAIPTRYDNRTQGIEIARGWTDIDAFTFTIDKALEIEALPKPIAIENKFGTYKMSIEEKGDNVLEYKRTYILNNGSYDKSEYEAFRDFLKAIVKHDKAKLVLKKLK